MRCGKLGSLRLTVQFLKANLGGAISTDDKPLALEEADEIAFQSFGSIVSSAGSASSGSIDSQDISIPFQETILPLVSDLDTVIGFFDKTWLQVDPLPDRLIMPNRMHRENLDVRLPFCRKRISLSSDRKSSPQ